MAHKVRIPKLRIPFDFEEGHGHFARIEQDSEEEISQCVEAVLRTPLGSRVDEPEYGIPDAAFTQGDVDLGRIGQAVREWEPRAAFGIDEEYLAEELRHIRVNLSQTLED